MSTEWKFEVGEGGDGGESKRKDSTENMDSLKTQVVKQ